MARTSLRWEQQSLNCRWNTSVSSFLRFLPNEQLNYESEKYRFHLLRKATPKKISALKLPLLQFCFCNCLCLTQKPRRSFRQPSLLSCPPWSSCLQNHQVRHFRCNLSVWPSAKWNHFELQNPNFEAQKTLEKSAFGRLNPSLCVNLDINKQIKQNYFLLHRIKRITASQISLKLVKVHLTPHFVFAKTNPLTV